MKRLVITLKSAIKNALVSLSRRKKDDKIGSYISNGCKPWSTGYNEYKYNFIEASLDSPEILSAFNHRILPQRFGIGLDERVVEYPWIFSKINENQGVLLDAGSTFNFDFVVRNRSLKNKSLTIYTYYPEENCFFDLRISYVFGDLRDMYFEAGTFDVVVCQSTIEHIDMDNSIYGYEASHSVKEKSFEYLKAVGELVRVLKVNGMLILTFPFGLYENHGFFQQFDFEMLDRLTSILKLQGSYEIDYFKYERQGWRFAAMEELSTVQSYNPHTGKGKLDDGAAHCRSIACILFHKNK